MNPATIPAVPEFNPRAVPGNNKAPAAAVSADRLKSFVERLERLDEERKAISDDMKDIFQEIKSVGYDAPTVRKILALRKQDAADRAEQETLLDTYKHALGMDKAVAAVLSGTTLRQAAAEHGVSKSALHRRAAAAQAPLPPHNAKTGEIITEPSLDPVPPIAVDPQVGQPVQVDLEDAIAAKAAPPIASSLSGDDDLEIPAFLVKKKAKP